MIRGKLLLFLFFMPVAFLKAQNVWPAESWQNSLNLTAVDPLFSQNLSGSYWNEETQRLWVCVNNPGTVFCLRKMEGANTWLIDSLAGNACRFSIGGDVESVCQADEGDSTFYVTDESTSMIKRYKVKSNGQFQLLKSFDTSPFLPAYGNGLGAEGLAFVPDFWLLNNGFRKANGDLYGGNSASGGLFFIAHQNGGQIYAFDLQPVTGAVSFIGSYKTGWSESSGLEFDRSTGKLFIWHNIGTNYIEVTDLISTVSGTGRQIKKLVEFNGPKSGNLEGIAFTPACSDKHWYFSTDDGNSNGMALMWFRQFEPCIPSLRFSVSDSLVCVGDTVWFQDQSCGGCTSASVLWNFGQGANPSTASGHGPHPVVYNSPGFPSVRMRFQGGVSDSLLRSSAVHVRPKPVPLIAVSDSISCEGDTVLVQASPSGHYLWNTGDTLSSLAITESAWLQVQVSSVGGCKAVSDSVRILFYSLPQVQASIMDSSLCTTDEPVLLQGFPFGGTWSGTGVNGLFFEPGLSGAGELKLAYAFVDSLGCRNVDSIAVSVSICSKTKDAMPAESPLFLYDGHYLIFREMANRREESWELRDVLGRIAMQFPSGEERAVWDISALPPGLYFIGQPASVVRHKIIRH